MLARNDSKFAQKQDKQLLRVEYAFKFKQEVVAHGIDLLSKTSS